MRKKRTNKSNNRLAFQTLESRKLLAADLGLSIGEIDTAGDSTSTSAQVEVSVDSELGVNEVDVNEVGVNEELATNPSAADFGDFFAPGSTASDGNPSATPGVVPLEGGSLDLSDGADGVFGELDAENGSASYSFFAVDDGQVEVIVSTDLVDGALAIELTDAEGNAVEPSSSNSDGAFSKLTFDVTSGSVYALGVSSVDGVSAQFQLTASFEVGEPVDQHSDEVGSDATELDFSNSAAIVRGSLETDGDRDVFQFVAQADGEYAISAGEAQRDSNFNLSVTVYDANGEEVAFGKTNSEVGLDLSTTQGETYFVAINADQGQTGDYALLVTPQSGELPTGLGGGEGFNVDGFDGANGGFDVGGDFGGGTEGFDGSGIDQGGFDQGPIDQGGFGGFDALPEAGGDLAGSGVGEFDLNDLFNGNLFDAGVSPTDGVVEVGNGDAGFDGAGINQGGFDQGPIDQGGFDGFDALPEAGGDLAGGGVGEFDLNDFFNGNLFDAGVSPTDGVVEVGNGDAGFDGAGINQGGFDQGPIDQGGFDGFDALPEAGGDLAGSVGVFDLNDFFNRDFGDFTFSVNSGGVDVGNGFAGFDSSSFGGFNFDQLAGQQTSGPITGLDLGDSIAEVQLELGLAGSQTAGEGLELTADGFDSNSSDPGFASDGFDSDGFDSLGLNPSNLDQLFSDFGFSLGSGFNFA